jgi:uncharacterized membrane protein (DUF2068 family)
MANFAGGRGVSRTVRLPHPARPEHAFGLRTVALFELFKGLLAILLAIALLRFLHKDFGDVAEHFLRRFHINPDRHIGQMVMRFANGITDSRIWGLFFGAIGYTVVRVVEAYGLWCGRAWAEWFALLSGSLYLPFELRVLIRRPSLLHWSVLGINVAIVLYMAWIRWNAHKRKHATVVGRKS